MDKKQGNQSARYLLLIFLLAAAVRGLFLAEAASASYFGNKRISDAQEYHDMAVRIAEGTFDVAEPFWQPPLYPYLLALFYRAFGARLFDIQMFHVLVGSLNCALLYYVALLLFERRAALVAGLAACLYAPEWLFEVQPMEVTFILTMYLLIITELRSFLKNGGLFSLFTAGLLVGAAAISHGLALFLVPALVLWLLFSGLAQGRQAGWLRRWAGWAILLTAAAAICPAVVSLRNLSVTGKPVFISNKAGINLYIGNHPRYVEIVERRNGLEWEDFQREILEAGVKDSADINSFFLKETLRNIRLHPLAISRTLAMKIAVIMSGAEAKRNFPIYPLRGQSSALRALLWRVDLGFLGFFFPTGLLIPFAALGIAVALKRGASPAELLPLAVAAGHVCGLAVFHVCARYRLPAIFMLMPYAAVGATFAWDTCARRGARPSGERQPLPGSAERALSIHGAIAVFACAFALSCTGGYLLRAETRARDDAEHCYYQGLWLCESGRVGEGLAMIEKAGSIDPKYPEPKFALGSYFLHVRGDAKKALPYFEELKQMLPWHPKIEAERILAVSGMLSRSQ